MKKLLRSITSIFLSIIMLTTLTVTVYASIIVTLLYRLGKSINYPIIHMSYKTYPPIPLSKHII